MGESDYEVFGLPVRRELPEAHARFWKRLASPGTWWTGAERVAIAAEVRRARECGLCRERKAALSPNDVEGEHDDGGGLPPVAVEAVHRIATDPGRLTKAWLDRLFAAGLEAEAYVELAGTVAAAVSIDSFCRGVGLSPRKLPDPVPGEPSRQRPEGVSDGEAWVPMLSAADTAREAGFAEGFLVPNVVRALSLVPEEVRTLADLTRAHYMPDLRVADPTAGGYSLTRPQMELVAARVSKLNDCFY